MEIETIFRDTGFQLSHPEQSASQFLMEWLLKDSVSSDYLLYPMTNFSGSVESPHSLWMERTNKQEVPIFLPAQSRLDSIMGQNSIEKLLPASAWTAAWSQTQAQNMQKRILQDRGDLEADKIHLKSMPSLSASQFERYFQCAFKFAAGKIFHLLDEALIDLDPDQRSLGNLVHQLFERLSVEPRRYDLNEVELEKILDEISKNFLLGDPRLWPPLRKKYVQLALRFLQAEKETAAERKRTLPGELKFKTELDGFTWKGSIDRVDEMQDGSFSILDYKASDKAFSVAGWMKKNHLQMAFYVWLIKHGHIEDLRNKEISGALYYIYRDFRKMGVHPGNEKEHSLLQEALKQVEAKMEILKGALKEGNFAPKPLSLDECSQCQWSQLCRAPHLN